MTPMGTKIHQKSVKIQAWTSKCPLLCSPVSQNRPRVPQDAKVKPPIMPNDKFASQKYQDPLATMPRICNPEAMSNDRGPAAEGVAHKIFFHLFILNSIHPSIHASLPPSIHSSKHPSLHPSIQSCIRPSIRTSVHIHSCAQSLGWVAKCGTGRHASQGNARIPGLVSITPVPMPPPTSKPRPTPTHKPKPTSTPTPTSARSARAGNHAYSHASAKANARTETRAHAPRPYRRP